MEKLKSWNTIKEDKSETKPVDINKGTSIRKIFAKYLFMFCFGTLVIFPFCYILFQIGINKGEIRPANYYEKLIDNKTESLKTAKDIKEILPSDIKYIIYEPSGKVLEGNVSDKEKTLIYEGIKKNPKIVEDYFYKVIDRKKDRLVILYKIQSSYKNSVLQKYLPNPVLSLLVLFIVLFGALVIMFSKRFGKTITKELQILKRTTERIETEDLDFKTESSKITEVNEILNSLDKMRKELKTSLSSQWEMENERKLQIAALAHDIKTPLTILRGNSELLSEECLNQKQENFIDQMLISIDDIERYLCSLVDIAKSEKVAGLNFNEVNTKDFLAGIQKEGKLLAMDKGIDFISDINSEQEFIYVDETALKRALMNIISNAIEYTPPNGKILFSVKSVAGKLRMLIEDSGRGFTAEEMLLATKQFYRGDKSRNSKNHYGMGLYIAEKFAGEHDGELILANSDSLGGAKVIVELEVARTSQ